MHILLSNDDGYRAPGLLALWQVLSARWEVSVSAPARDRSGTSNSLTLRNPLRAERRENGFIVIEGTPADCVHLALTGLLDDEPDLVVSGINSGCNLGDDVLYSGTVAAALEGRHLGLPAMAVSLVGPDPRHYVTAAIVVERFLDDLVSWTFPAGTVLNVNVPDRPIRAIRGVRATRLGHRHRPQPAVADRDSNGERVYWFGGVGSARDSAPGTDFHAVEEGFVSVTPIHADLTRHRALETIDSWVGDIVFG